MSFWPVSDGWEQIGRGDREERAVQGVLDYRTYCELKSREA